jgi:hypothetical protein
VLTAEGGYMSPSNFTPEDLYYLFLPCQSGRGGECNRIFTKPADAISAASNVTNGQIWRQTFVPITITTPAGDITATRIDWAKFYDTPPEGGRGGQPAVPR